MSNKLLILASFLLPPILSLCPVSLHPSFSPHLLSPFPSRSLPQLSYGVWRGLGGDPIPKIESYAFQTKKETIQIKHSCYYKAAPNSENVERLLFQPPTGS